VGNGLQLSPAADALRRSHRDRKCRFARNPLLSRKPDNSHENEQNNSQPNHRGGPVLFVACSPAPYGSTITVTMFDFTVSCCNWCVKFL